MAVNTNFINKPFNPRGNDQSPKGYNRAALYSGKALDFDGVNDWVDLAGLTLSGSNQSFAFYLKADSWNNFDYIFDIFSNRFIIGSTPANNLSIYDGTSWQSFGEINDTTNTNFFVITIEGTTSKAYLNGVQFGSNLTIALRDFSAASECGLMSQYDGAQLFFPGQIAGFKIFNTALTAAQVADLYNNPEKVVPTGVDNTALKLWLPMQEGAGTTAYDGAADLTDYVTNGDFSDGTNNWTASNATLSVEGGALKVTSTGGNRPQGYQTITGLTIGRKYLLSAVARVGTTSYNMEIEISGIGASGSYNKTSNSTDTYIYTEFTAGSTTHIVQAKIDESNVPAGETGFFDDIKLLDLGNYGTISGATWTHGIGAPVAQTSVIDWNKWYLDHTNEVLIPQGLTSGRDLLGNLFENVRKQGALNLDGNSWAEVHDNASLDITDAITLECWVYFDGSNGKGLLGRWSTGADNNYLLYNSTSSKGQFYINTTAVSLVNTSTLTAGNWYHIVGTYDGSDMRIYLNGSEESNTSKTGSISTSADPIEIGRYYQNSSFAYADQIAQPRIYNRALTAEEVQRNYNAGKNTYTN